jgi:hypothetical protein
MSRSIWMASLSPGERNTVSLRRVSRRSSICFGHRLGFYHDPVSPPACVDQTFTVQPGRREPGFATLSAALRPNSLAITF